MLNVLSINQIKCLSRNIPLRFTTQVVAGGVSRSVRHLYPRYHRCEHQVLCAVAVASLICSISRASEIGRSVSWDVEDATLRFRIEKDHTYPQVPDVHLSDLKAEKGSSSVRKSKTNGQWAGRYYELNGKLYKGGIAISAPANAVYKYQKEFGRFVALAGVSDRADPNASASFEVYADWRELYKSGLLTKQMPPVEINLQIPPGTKQLKLLTDGSNMNNHRWANWVNAGFLLKGKNPKVSYVKVYTPGYDPTDFEAAVFTSTGRQVGSQLLWTKQGEPMEILFDNSQGRAVYFVYLVHKNKYKLIPLEWEPKAGLILETRRTAKTDPKCHELSGLLEVWDEDAEPVGRSLVDGIHRGFPIYRMPDFGSDNPSKKGGLALYRYKGFFRTEKKGQYIFAIASDGGSHLLIDGNVVVSWPGEHDYRAGIRGEKQGQVMLEPGVHKLEYLNCSPWGKMFTLAALQRPEEKLNLVTRSDFLPVRRYVVTAIGYNELTKDGGSFEWQIADDWRADQRQATLVQVRFNVIKAGKADDCSYRWKFDDGKIETGESVEHVFLRPGMRTVTLEVLKDQEVFAEVTQRVHAHALWDSTHLEPKNMQTFEKAISESDFSKVPIGDVVNVYAFADGVKRPPWKQKAVAALVKRVDELVAESQHWHFCLELGQHLSSTPIQQYEQALELFTLLAEKSAKDRLVRQQAMVSQAELLVQCFGKAQEALEIINRLEKEKGLDKEVAHHFGIVQAEALIAVGETKRAREILQNMSESSKQQNKTKQEIGHMGMLRHARLLAEDKDDPVQLDYAMEKIEAVLAQEPMKVLMPSLNLIRLDVHLARREYLIAFHLAERLNKLELSNYDRLEVLVLQVKALCGIKAVEQAKVIYETVTQDYPYSPAVVEAKKAIVEAVVAGQK